MSFNPETLPKLYPLVFIEDGRPPVLLWFPVNSKPVHQCSLLGVYSEIHRCGLTVYMTVEQAERGNVLYQTNRKAS